MTFQTLLGGSLSLRPPLPIAPRTAQSLPLSSNRDAGLRMPPVSFLFRMIVACHVLQFSTETRFTALVLLHRYGQAKQESGSSSTTNNNNPEDWPWIGAICLFLASKTENETRRLRDIINMAQMVLSSSSSSEQEREFNTDDNSLIVLDTTKTPALDGAYWDSKKKAIETEQMVLRWLGFDCFVSQPHRAVFWILEQNYAIRESFDEDDERKNTSNGRKNHQTNDGSRDTNVPAPRPTSDGSDNPIRDEIIILSSQRLNDALFYPRALQWGVIEMACASIDLAVADVLEQYGHDPNAPSGTATTTTKTTKTTQHGTTKNPFANHTKNLKAIFKHGWWTRYEISNKDFNDCRKTLTDATCYLKSIGPTKPC